PWAPLRDSEPIGDLHVVSDEMARSCLILLAPEGASDSGTRRQHVPPASRLTTRHACGMTEFHRPNKGTPPVLGTPPEVVPSSPGMTARPGIHPESPSGTGAAGDYTAAKGRNDGGRIREHDRPDRST